MTSIRIRFCLVLISFFISPPSAEAQRELLLESIQRRDADMWQAATTIWTWAEPGYQETRSSELLASMLHDAGFEVHRGVADIPTAFTATFGDEGPVIGLLGEYDALPGLSQEAIPFRKPRRNQSYGHACGHHLFGVASASAAIALKERIAAGDLVGRVRFYGCPAEEGGSAKVFLVRAGLFDDCDAVLHWHPAAQNAAGDKSSLARMAVKFRFRGKSAHAAGAPQQGRSSLDAVELTNHAAQLMREHTPDKTRIHHVITSGGSAPNVVPEFAEVYYYVRHPQPQVVRELYERLVLCARAGALATQTDLEIQFEGGILNILPNKTLAQVSMANLQALNDLNYTKDDIEFATRLQQSLASPKPLDEIQIVIDRSGTVGMGSTDVGDVSWSVPTAGFTTACWVPGTPGHSWQAVACGGTSIARRGMNLAARVLAATAWDLLTDPSLLKHAKLEHQERLGDRRYESLMEPGQKPPLDYRRPPSF